MYHIGLLCPPASWSLSTNHPLFFAYKTKITSLSTFKLQSKKKISIPATDDKFGGVGSQEHLLVGGQLLQAQANPLVLLLLGR
jgi:hypothetical protein